MKKLLLIIPVLIIVGCGLFGGEDYFPLSVNNEWRYEGYQYTADSLKLAMESKITGQDQIKSKDVFVFVNKTTNYRFYPAIDTTVAIDTIYFMESKDTIWRYEDKNDSTPMILTILPFELNKTWRVIDSISADTTVYTVTAQEDVSVPAGTYKNCWKLKINDGTTARHFWFADGVGIIKLSWTNYLLELKKATIK